MGSSSLPIVNPSSYETSLLSKANDKPPRTSPLFTALAITTTISLFSAFVFAFSFFSSSSPSCTTDNHSISTARPLSKHHSPRVILLSFDGFRFGYQFKTPTPNIHRLINEGTSADLGLIPVFPTLTFPNHYSIATGLYPPYHGIVNNNFLDPASGETFTTRSHEPKWWLGEPIWETVVNHGLPAAAYYWAGAEVIKGNWSCPPAFCPKFNISVPFEDRVDTVLSNFDLPKKEIPAFTAVYFPDPDSQGHKYGPDHPEITKAVAHVDSVVGRLIQGLEKRGIFEDVSIILLGDHGMVSTCDNKYIFLEDLAPWIETPSSWVQSKYQLLTIQPPPNVSASGVVAKMKEALSSGKVNNGDKLNVFLKEELPLRLHYSESNRIPSIVGLVEEGYSVEISRSEGVACVGTHGYDNMFSSMRSIFVGHGPQFKKGKKVPSFMNVEVYNMITYILKLKGAPNNGSTSFLNSILLPNA